MVWGKQHKQRCIGLGRLQLKCTCAGAVAVKAEAGKQNKSETTYSGGRSGSL